MPSWHSNSVIPYSLTNLKMKAKLTHNQNAYDLNIPSPLLRTSTKGLQLAKLTSLSSVQGYDSEEITYVCENSAKFRQKNPKKSNVILDLNCRSIILLRRFLWLRRADHCFLGGVAPLRGSCCDTCFQENLKMSLVCCLLLLLISSV